jgi:hypothetical protein
MQEERAEEVNKSTPFPVHPAEALRISLPPVVAFASAQSTSRRLLRPGHVGPSRRQPRGLAMPCKGLNEPVQSRIARPALAWGVNRDHQGSSLAGRLFTVAPCACLASHQHSDSLISYIRLNALVSFAPHRIVL